MRRKRNSGFPHGLGWLKDPPDDRDYTRTSTRLLRRVTERLKPTRATAVDLRPFCPPVEDQGRLGSCTAQAGAGLLEFYERKAFGRHIDASRLFLYKVTRNLMKVTGDTGAYLRTTMKAMAHFGVCPEEFWPYNPKDFDKEPSAFLYAYAQTFKGLEYYRLDRGAARRDDLLEEIRRNLANNLPVMFGFLVFPSIRDAEKTGLIPAPQRGESVVGGHAVVAVGYDDTKRIGKHQGALLIRNSWGIAWGEQGYGWLPYEYVLRSLAEDFWALMKADYIDSHLFEDIPQHDEARPGKGRGSRP